MIGFDFRLEIVFLLVAAVGIAFLTVGGLLLVFFDVHSQAVAVQPRFIALIDILFAEHSEAPGFSGSGVCFLAPDVECGAIDCCFDGGDVAVIGGACHRQRYVVGIRGRFLFAFFVFSPHQHLAALERRRQVRWRQNATYGREVVARLISADSGKNQGVVKIDELVKRFIGIMGGNSRILRDFEGAKVVIELL